MERSSGGIGGGVDTCSSLPHTKYTSSAVNHYPKVRRRRLTALSWEAPLHIKSTRSSPKGHRWPSLALAIIDKTPRVSTLSPERLPLDILPKRSKIPPNTSSTTPTLEPGPGQAQIGASAPGPASGQAQKLPTKGTTNPKGTCDNCRKRKIRCVEDAVDTEQACEGCKKIGLQCSYAYVKKKPGRKNGFAMAMKASQEPESKPETKASMHPPRTSLSAASINGYHPYSPGSIRSNITTSPSFSLGMSSSLDSTLAGPSNYAMTDSTTSFGSPHSPVQSTSIHRPLSSFAFSPRSRHNYSGNHTGLSNTPGASNNLDWLDSMLEGTAVGSIGDNGGFNFNSDGNLTGFSDFSMGGFVSDQAHLLSLESPENLAGTSSNASNTTPKGSQMFSNNVSGPSVVGRRSNSVVRREPQLEDVTSWANISHFISLFLQYLYPLLPLVHRPTFAEHLATRRDIRDSDFRALLLSIVAYVISQLPTSRLVTDTFDVESLKRLQRRCHRTCKSLQRTYYGPTNLTQITTIIFDTFYLLSIGLGHTAGSRLGQAVQLAFSMNMHSDEKTNSLGLDAIEVQLRRRVFWQLYASDKTRAIPGPPMLINDFQGICSLPEPVDDEFITSQGMFPQPASRTSILAGFVSVSMMFKILSECFFHHRCITTAGLKTTSSEWTVDAEERLHQILREMPLVIQDPAIVGDETNKMRQVFALQRANILITAAIAKFALYDLRAALNVDDDQLTRERENIAREIHSLLMNIPVEDLASNGESVRGKVFHIACALCVQAPDQADQDLIRDWCNMFSAISFVQMPPPQPGASALDSRANSPPSTGEEGVATSSILQQPGSV